MSSVRVISGGICGIAGLYLYNDTPTRKKTIQTPNMTKPYMTKLPDPNNLKPRIIAAATFDEPKIKVASTKAEIHVPQIADNLNRLQNRFVKFSSVLLIDDSASKSQVTRTPFNVLMTPSDFIQSFNMHLTIHFHRTSCQYGVRLSHLRAVVR